MPKRKPATDVRDAITGKFAPKSKAKTDPATTVTTRRKVKPAGVLAWCLQNVETGALDVLTVSKTSLAAGLSRECAAEPKRWRVVRVRIEVAE